MNTIGDPTFNLNPQALAVLAMLSRREPAFAEYDKDLGTYKIEIETSPWYNGRERGVCLNVRRSFSDKTCLLITFGEHRNTDGIFIDCWVHKGHFMNPPTLKDYNDKAYKGRHTVNYGRVDLAVEYILDKMKAYYEALPKTPAATTVKDITAAIRAIERRNPGILPDLGDES
jgi:hypothetical protein